MARRKLREFDAKRLIRENIGTYSSIRLPGSSLLVTTETILEDLPKQYPWLLTQKLVVKPDQLFGKRKKYGLVLVNADYEKVKEFITQYRNKPVTIGKAIDLLTHFLIEQFIVHKEEYYLAFVSGREGDWIYFSQEGGIDIEENWDKVLKIAVPTLQEEVSLGDLPIPAALHLFIKAVFKLYRELDFTYLEFNPFTLDEQGNIILLDAVAEIDDCAAGKNQKKWQPEGQQLEFPAPFGRKVYLEEQQIAELDEQSGASLKLTILNPRGRVWNILSGGGASIIYLDAIANYGKANEIANYGEYSGNPTTEESYQYAKTVLDLMTRKPTPTPDASPHDPGGVSSGGVSSGKLNSERLILFIAGAIANFTDVEKTFLGIVKALEEYREKLREKKVSIYVRRGGPNWEKGLQLMKETGERLGLPMQVYGPEMPMTEIMEKAFKEVEKLKEVEK